MYIKADKVIPKLAEDDYVTTVDTPEGPIAAHRHDSETDARRAHLDMLGKGIPQQIDDDGQSEAEPSQPTLGDSMSFDPARKAETPNQL